MGQNSMTVGMKRWALAMCVAGCMGLAACGGGSKSNLPDASTPQKAAAAFLNAMYAGDTATAHALSVGNDTESKYVDMMSAFFVAGQKFDAAVKAKFPEATDFPTMTPPNKAGEMASWDAKIDGDSAMIMAKGSSDDTHKLKKSGDIWKVDLSTLDGQTEEMAKAPAGTQALNEMTDNINAGKYKTAADLQEDFAKKMAPMMGG